MDLEKCLEILRNRPICEGSGVAEHDGHGHHHHHHHDQPSQQPQSQAQSQAPMGQVIDLLQSASLSAAEQEGKEEAGAAAAATAGEAEGEAAVPPEARAQASVAKLREGMKGLSGRKLLAAFRQAQEDRARAYAAFEEGLAGVLKSRDFAAYDGVCAEATAAFAALSNLVNAVAGELAASPGAGGGGCAALLRRVQAEEKEKLSLTAALHLERFRLATASCGGGEGAASEAALLRDGVKTLEGRLGAVKGRINEVLEELRYEMAEMVEEEGGGGEGE